MKFGVREICDVVLRAKSTQKIGNKIFYKNEPVCYFDTLKTSTFEGASSTVYATGGRGNARLMSWDGERTVTFTMEDALISPIGLSILTGAGLIDATTEKPIIVHKIEQLEIDFSNIQNGFPVFTLSEVPYTRPDEPTIYVMGLDTDGSPMTEPYLYTVVDDSEISETGSATNKTIGFWSQNAYTAQENLRENSISLLDCSVVLVDYYTKETSGVFEVNIAPDKFGGTYYLEASTLWRDQGTGKDLPAEFIIPSCRIQSNFSFSMSASGDPSTFSFTVDAFPDYTRWDKTQKVLADIQVIGATVGGIQEIPRTETWAKDESVKLVTLDSTLQPRQAKFVTTSYSGAGNNYIWNGQIQIKESDNNTEKKYYTVTAYADNLVYANIAAATSDDIDPLDNLIKINIDPQYLSSIRNMKFKVETYLDNDRTIQSEPINIDLKNLDSFSKYSVKYNKKTCEFLNWAGVPVPATSSTAHLDGNSPIYRLYNPMVKVIVQSDGAGSSLKNKIQIGFHEMFKYYADTNTFITESEDNVAFFKFTGLLVYKTATPLAQMVKTNVRYANGTKYSDKAYCITKNYYPTKICQYENEELWSQFASGEHVDASSDQEDLHNVITILDERPTEFYDATANDHIMTNDLSKNSGKGTMGIRYVVVLRDNLGNLWYASNTGVAPIDSDENFIAIANQTTAVSDSDKAKEQNLNYTVESGSTADTTNFSNYDFKRLSRKMLAFTQDQLATRKYHYISSALTTEENSWSHYADFNSLPQG